MRRRCGHLLILLRLSLIASCHQAEAQQKVIRELQAAAAMQNKGLPTSVPMKAEAKQDSGGEQKDPLEVTASSS